MGNTNGLISTIRVNSSPILNPAREVQFKVDADMEVEQTIADTSSVSSPATELGGPAPVAESINSPVEETYISRSNTEILIPMARNITPLILMNQEIPEKELELLYQRYPNLTKLVMDYRAKHPDQWQELPENEQKIIIGDSKGEKYKLTHTLVDESRKGGRANIYKAIDETGAVFIVKKWDILRERIEREYLRKNKENPYAGQMADWNELGNMIILKNYYGFSLKEVKYALTELADWTDDLIIEFLEVIKNEYMPAVKHTAVKFNSVTYDMNVTNNVMLTSEGLKLIDFEDVMKSDQNTINFGSFANILSLVVFLEHNKPYLSLQTLIKLRRINILNDELTNGYWKFDQVSSKIEDAISDFKDLKSKESSKKFTLKEKTSAFFGWAAVSPEMTEQAAIDLIATVKKYGFSKEAIPELEAVIGNDHFYDDLRIEALWALKEAGAKSSVFINILEKVPSNELRAMAAYVLTLFVKDNHDPAALFANREKIHSIAENIISQTTSWLTYTAMLNLLNALGYSTETIISPLGLDAYFPNATEKIERDLTALVKSINNKYDNIIKVIAVGPIFQTEDGDINTGNSFTKKRAMFYSDLNRVTVIQKGIIKNKAAEKEFVQGLHRIGIEDGRWNKVKWVTGLSKTPRGLFRIYEAGKFNYEQRGTDKYEDAQSRPHIPLRKELLRLWDIPSGQKGSLSLQERDILRRLHSIATVVCLTRFYFLFPLFVNETETLKNLCNKGLIRIDNGRINLGWINKGAAHPIEYITIDPAGLSVTAEQVSGQLVSPAESISSPAKSNDDKKKEKEFLNQRSELTEKMLRIKGRIELGAAELSDKNIRYLVNGARDLLLEARSLLKLSGAGVSSSEDLFNLELALKDISSLLEESNPGVNNNRLASRVLVELMPALLDCIGNSGIPNKEQYHKALNYFISDFKLVVDNFAEILSPGREVQYLNRDNSAEIRELAWNAAEIEGLISKKIELICKDLELNKKKITLEAFLEFIDKMRILAEGQLAILGMQDERSKFNSLFELLEEAEAIADEPIWLNSDELTARLLHILRRLSIMTSTLTLAVESGKKQVDKKSVYEWIREANAALNALAPQFRYTLINTKYLAEEAMQRPASSPVGLLSSGLIPIDPKERHTFDMTTVISPSEDPQTSRRLIGNLIDGVLSDEYQSERVVFEQSGKSVRRFDEGKISDDYIDELWEQVGQLDREKQIHFQRRFLSEVLRRAREGFSDEMRASYETADIVALNYFGEIQDTLRGLLRLLERQSAPKNLRREDYVNERDFLESVRAIAVAHEYQEQNEVSFWPIMHKIMLGGRVYFDGGFYDFGDVIRHIMIAGQSIQDLIGRNQSHFFRYRDDFCSAEYDSQYPRLRAALTDLLEQKIHEARTADKKQIIRFGVIGAGFGQEAVSLAYELEQALDERKVDRSLVDYEVHVLSLPDPIYERLKANRILYPAEVLRSNGDLVHYSLFGGPVGQDWDAVRQRGGRVITDEYIARLFEPSPNFPDTFARSNRLNPRIVFHDFNILDPDTFHESSLLAGALDCLIMEKVAQYIVPERIRDPSHYPEVTAQAVRHLRGLLRKGGIMFVSRDENRFDFGYQLMHGELFVRIEDDVSSPVVSEETKTPGGIDFRSLPIVTQAISNLSANLRDSPLRPADGGARGQSLININLTAEWQAIIRMCASGITPSPERIKEYVQASCAKEAIAQDKDKIIRAISDILRQEEESCSSTEPLLRDILVMLESVTQPQELKRAFLGIT